MVRISVGAVAVVLLLATAGCNTPLADESKPPETPTLTPAPQPGTSTPTANASRFPPGLGPEGVTDAERLVDAHTDALANVSYTVRLSSTREYPNGSVQTRYERVVRFASPDRFHYVLTVRSESGDRRIERWRSGDTAFAAVTTDGDTTYRRLDEPQRPTLVTYSELTRVFGLEPSRLADTTIRNGTTLYRLEGGPGDVSGLSNVSYVALVDPRGLVRSYTVTYDVTDRDRTRSVEVAASFGAVGETTVERPPWYDDAV